MTKKLEMYKCEICGNVIQVLIEGAGELVCCGQAMTKVEPHMEDNNEIAEKHIPQIINDGNKKKIVLEHHPMVPEHYIQFIEAISKDEKYIFLKYLQPNEKAEFDILDSDKDVYALELCNIHGLWRSKND